MADDLFTLGIENTLADARIMMVQNRIRHIPIVDENNVLLGIISQRDVLAAEESSLLITDKFKRFDYEQSVKVIEFYRSEIMTINSKASVHQAALTIQKYKIGCLPILANGELIGLVTASDFVNVAINLIEVLAAQEPEQ
jgi:CBS domain-containing protein